MPKPEDYTDLDPQELRERLALAESLCLMFGWSPANDDSPRDKAAYELWRRWTDHVGYEFMSPDLHPDLDDEAVDRLALIVDARRERTLKGAADDG